MTKARTSTLSGLRIAVTGAGRGIGLATAEALHARGATVVIGDIDLETATAAAAGIGPDVQALALDVSDHASFGEFLKQAGGHLDVLVNNAGIMPIGRFLDLSPELHRRTVDINVLGCVHGMHLALPAMLERGSGHIINVASTAGKTPVPGGVTYCGTKSAVVALTETARVEYAGSGVDFTCVLPHFTNTELIAGTSGTKLISTVQPEDVAAAIADAVERPRPDVFVPRTVGLILRTQPLLGRPIRDFLNRKLGAYRAFLDIDPQARAGYTQRITKS